MMFTSRIITAKIVPAGIEGTLMSLSGTLVQLGYMTIRNLLGVLINNTFVHITRDSITNYYVLVFIKLFGAFIPLTFMMKFLPTNKEVQDL